MRAESGDGAKEEKDSVFPTVARGSFLGTFNLRSLGMALAVAWLAAMLWSPAVVSPFYREQGLDLHMHLARLTLLVSLCAVYTIVRIHPPNVLDKRSNRWIAAAFVVSPLPLAGALFPGVMDAVSSYPALDVLFWTCGGCSAAVIMLVWGYRMDTKENYGQAVVNVAASAAFSGVLFILISLLSHPVSVVVVMCLPFAMLVLWRACADDGPTAARHERVGRAAERSVVRTGVRSALGSQAVSFVFSYGFVMGLAGAIGTGFAIDRYAAVYVGAATASAGIAVLYAARAGRLRMSGRSFFLFLPFAVFCLFFFSLANEQGKVVLLFLVFAVVNACNVFNTAYETGDEASVGEGRHAFSDGYARFVGESRTADMVGSALGWGVGTAVGFLVEAWWEPYCYFLIAVVLVGVTAVAAVFQRDTATAHADTAASLESLKREWEVGCIRLARAHDLSAREQEVFLFLSRGRDRQYVHETLGVSLSTVRTHAYHLYRKLGVHNQQQLIDLVEAELSRSEG